ncbi:MAG: glycosyltransferase family 4 protein [Planctomycetaceae bacterium]|nr:glycosyltransferase family 4 protein [Planctomycetaceae bacterium]
MRVAIVHDWLVTWGGSERVLEQMLALYPQADLFTVVDFLPAAQRAPLAGRKITTSFIQRLPKARTHYNSYLPLMPVAIEQFDLSGYDLVLSSSHCVAKGVITGPNQVHVSYIHSPMRYAWDMQHEYLHEAGLETGVRSWLVRWMLHKLRVWDARSASGVDACVANSSFIARRIAKAYRRQAPVIHPPVDVEQIAPGGAREDFYLTASRLVPYKRVDLIVEAFATMPNRRLVVIGDGPELESLRKKATPNVQLLGYQSTPVLHDHLRRAKAFVFAALEDFGIILAEAQAAGTPVVAFGQGGARDIIRGLDSPNPTGVFIDEQTPESLKAGLRRFEREAGRIDPADCRRNAERFGAERFREEFAGLIAEVMQSFEQRCAAVEPRLPLAANVLQERGDDLPQGAAA